MAGACGREAGTGDAGGGTASGGGWLSGSAPTGMGAVVGEALASSRAPSAEPAEHEAEYRGNSVCSRTGDW